MLRIHLTILNFSQCICNISGVRGMTTVYPHSRKCMQYRTFQHRTLSVRSPSKKDQGDKVRKVAHPCLSNMEICILYVAYCEVMGRSIFYKNNTLLLCSTITSIWGNNNLFIKHSQINYTNHNCSLAKKSDLFLQLSQFDGYRLTNELTLKPTLGLKKLFVFLYFNILNVFSYKQISSCTLLKTTHFLEQDQRSKD